MRYNVLVRRSYSIPGRLAPSRVEEWIVVDPQDTQAAPNPAAAMAIAKQKAEEEHGGVASVHSCVPLPVEVTAIYDAENWANDDMELVAHTARRPTDVAAIQTITPGDDAPLAALVQTKRKPGRPPKAQPTRPPEPDESPIDARADAAAREAIERMGLVAPQTEG